MSIFKTSVPAKVTVSKRAFTDRFREHIRTVADMRPSNKGKSILDDEALFPKPVDLVDDDAHTKLSNERERQSKTKRRHQQIILDVALQIASGLVTKMETSGEVFELNAHGIYEASGRRHWVMQTLNGMSNTDFEAGDPDPYLDIEKKFGELIIIDRVKKLGTIRVLRDSALPADWSMVIHRQLNRAKNISMKADRAYAAVRRIQELSKKDEPFGESKARYYDAIRLGKIKPVDHDDD